MSEFIALLACKYSPKGLLVAIQYAGIATDTRMQDLSDPMETLHLVTAGRTMYSASGKDSWSVRGLLGCKQICKPLLYLLLTGLELLKMVPELLRDPCVVSTDVRESS
jgi:hypothetical protein